MISKLDLQTYMKGVRVFICARFIRPWATSKQKILVKYNTHTHTHTHTHIYIIIYIYIYISSSSSYRAGSTDIPDPLSPLLPIVHRPRQDIYIYIFISEIETGNMNRFYLLMDATFQKNWLLVTFFDGYKCILFIVMRKLKGFYPSSVCVCIYV